MEGEVKAVCQVPRGLVRRRWSRIWRSWVLSHGRQGQSEKQSLSGLELLIEKQFILLTREMYLSGWCPIGGWEDKAK